MKKENLLLTALIILVFVMGFFIGKNYNNDSGRYFFKEYKYIIVPFMVWFGIQLFKFIYDLIK